MILFNKKKAAKNALQNWLIILQGCLFCYYPFSEAVFKGCSAPVKAVFEFLPGQRQN